MQLYMENLSFYTKVWVILDDDLVLSYAKTAAVVARDSLNAVREGCILAVALGCRIGALHMVLLTVLPM